MSGAVGEHGAIPRVAHRHMYLWIEEQIEARDSVTKGLTTIESLDNFYHQVRMANEGNRHYSFSKLQELVSKAPPYSLLYNKTLNLSTNVLKRWNRSNGMINWFLRKIGRGPPTADEVIQVARVHLARSVIKRGDYNAPIPHYVTDHNGMPVLLGKRTRDDGSDMLAPTAIFGPPPVHAADPVALYEVLNARYEGKITQEDVVGGVEKTVWYFDGGSYCLNSRRLDDWSVGNGAWQHFSEFINEHGIKHDQFLFDFGPDKLSSRESRERDRQREKLKEKQRFREKLASMPVPGATTPNPYEPTVTSSSSSSMSLDRTTFPSGARSPVPPSSYSGSTGPGPAFSRYGAGPMESSSGSGSTNNLLGPPSQRPRYAPPTHHSNPPWALPPTTSSGMGSHQASTLYELFASFQEKLVRKVTASSSTGLSIKLLGARLHEWDEVDINDWATRSFLSTEIFVLFPYFMRLDNPTEGGGARSNPTAAMLGHPVAGRVQQVGVYTFEYGDDRYLVVCAYLVADGREARFFAKYLLTSKGKILMPYGAAPVSLGLSNPTQYMHQDDVKAFQLWWLAEATLSSSLGGHASHPRDLTDLLRTSLRNNMPTLIRRPSHTTSYYGEGMGGGVYGQGPPRDMTPSPSGSYGRPEVPMGREGGVPALREAAGIVSGSSHRGNGGQAAEVHRI